MSSLCLSGEPPYADFIDIWKVSQSLSPHVLVSILLLGVNFRVRVLESHHLDLSLDSIDHGNIMF